jgi:hypothetical protein
MKEPTEEEMKEVMGGKWRNDFTCVYDTAGPPLAVPPFVASGASATAGLRTLHIVLDRAGPKNNLERARLETVKRRTHPKSLSSRHVLNHDFLVYDDMHIC